MNIYVNMQDYSQLLTYIFSPFWQVDVKWTSSRFKSKFLIKLFVEIESVLGLGFAHLIHTYIVIIYAIIFSSTWMSGRTVILN